MKDMDGKEKVVFLQGERLYLRPVNERDIGRCMRWINDPELRFFIAHQFPVTETMEIEWVRRQNQGRPPADLGLGIVLDDDDRHIGNIGLHGINWVYRHATTGMVIGEKDCRNKGYGHEAKELLLRYAFDTLNLHRVSSAALATNPRSIACLKKSGYREEGRRREAYFRDGKWVDEVLLGLTRTDWFLWNDVSFDE